MQVLKRSPISIWLICNIYNQAVLISHHNYLHTTDEHAPLIHPWPNKRLSFKKSCHRWYFFFKPANDWMCFQKIDFMVTRKLLSLLNLWIIMFLYVRQQIDLNMAIWKILHTIEHKMYECRRSVCVVACFLLFAQLCLSRPGLAVCCPPPFCITVFPSLTNLALRPACTLSTSSLATVRQGKYKDKYKYM